MSVRVRKSRFQEKDENTSDVRTVPRVWISRKGQRHPRYQNRIQMKDARKSASTNRCQKGSDDNVCAENGINNSEGKNERMEENKTNETASRFR